MITKIKRMLLVIIASVMYAPYFWAQGIIVYKSDGTMDRISYAAIDSIVSYANHEDKNNGSETDIYKVSGSSTSSSFLTSNQSSSSSSGSGYVPRMIYTGVDMGTGVDINAGNGNLGTPTTIQVEKRCHLCAGTGICTTCNGRGQIINSYTGQYQDCPNCSNPIGKCHSCGGTGRK